VVSDYFKLKRLKNREKPMPHHSQKSPTPVDALIQLFQRIRGFLGRHNPGTLELIALLTYVIGVIGRILYATVYHAPNHFVYTDAIDYMWQAFRFLDPDSVQRLGNAIWPPGTSAVMAGLYSADITMGIATFVVLALNCLVPLLVAHTAALLSNRTSGFVALIIASLSVGFIHYTGIFISESFFIFAVSLAVWMTALAICRVDGPLATGKSDATAGADTERAVSLLQMAARFGALFVSGIPAGICWALATMFRPNAWPVLFGISVGLGIFWIRRPHRHRIIMIAGVVVAAAIFIAPLVHRCSLLKGDGICMVSTNSAMNVVMGQVGEYRSVNFIDPDTGKGSKWSPPSLGMLRYKGVKDVPISMYDNAGLIWWVWHEFTDNPVLFITHALGNGLDVFGVDYWPQRAGILGHRPLLVASQLFIIFVLVPAFIVFILGIPRLIRRQANSRFVFAWVGVASVFLLAALSMGEARYRLPFDAFWIALAAGFWQGSRGDVLWQPGASPEGGCPVSRTGFRLAASVTAVIAACACAYIVAVSHPAISLAHHFSPNLMSRSNGVLHKSRRILDKPKQNNDPWDKDTVVIECDRLCEELRVDFEKPKKASRIELSLSVNDCYQIRLYRDGRQVYTEVLLPQKNRGSRRDRGLRRFSVRLPREGIAFSEIGIQPLFGDGDYSVGHVIPR
jgi:hypothetical protein